MTDGAGWCETGSTALRCPAELHPGDPRSVMNWKPLDDVNKRFICDEISRQLAVAAVKRHSPWAIHLIKQGLWFWTADGQDGEGNAGRDKIKYSIQHLWHSERVCSLTRQACAQGLARSVRLHRNELRMNMPCHAMSSSSVCCRSPSWIQRPFRVCWRGSASELF